jgi:hypothetical protein
LWYSITLCCTTAITTLLVTASGGDWRARLEIKQAISSHIIPLLSHNQDGVITDQGMRPIGLGTALVKWDAAHLLCRLLEAQPLNLRIR